MSDGVFDYYDDVNIFFILNFIFGGILGREFEMVGSFFYMNGNESRSYSFEYVEYVGNYDVNK